MYTVIILNKRSSDLMKDYKFLFKPFVDEGLIGFCDWNESGTDVKSSVPDLYNMIRGKKDWRAMVINTDSAWNYRDTPVPSRGNPFDFSASDKIEIPHESPIPMIRLTHIIGGYTAVSKKEFEKGFEYFDEEEGTLVRVREADLTEDEIHQLSEDKESLNPIYMEKEVPEEVAQAEKELKKKYSFSDVRPTEIQLISTTYKAEDNETRRITESWKNRLEMTSSSFWERNKYPNNTRFLFYELTNSDNSHYVQELTEFWLSVLTLAINKVQASSLQAYRLYKIGVDVSGEQLADMLNTHLNKLTSVHAFVKEQLSLRPGYTFDEDEELLPRQPVPVNIDSREGSELYIDCNDLGLARDCPVDEMSFWNGQIKRKRIATDKFLKAPRRSIDKSASYLKSKSESFCDEDYLLDRFQAADLEEEMADLREEIITSRTFGYVNRKELEENIAGISKDVKKEIAVRMRRKTVITAGIIALALGCVGYFPYLINSAKSGGKAFGSALLLLLAVVLVMALGGLISLLLQRKTLVKIMKRYNVLMRGMINEVHAGADSFQKFFSDICTYMKGQSILDGISKHKESRSSNTITLSNHKKATLAAIDRDTSWLAAYGLTRVDEIVPNVTMFFDANVIPRYNNLYFFPPCNDEVDIPINATGDVVAAPYKFIKKIRVEREDVFDEMEGDD